MFKMSVTDILITMLVNRLSTDELEFFYSHILELPDETIKAAGRERDKKISNLLFEVWKEEQTKIEFKERLKTSFVRLLNHDIGDLGKFSNVINYLRTLNYIHQLAL